MDKRYQVFVSSTFKDLESERASVFQTLMQLDCIPAGMELFPAADEEQWAFIQKVIDDCDYYLLIVGGRYGSTTAEGISYTEKEYDYAVSKGVHVIAFLHSKPDEIPAGKSEVDPKTRKKLESFRKRISAGRLIRHWSNPAELESVVALSMSKAIKTYPRPGWVRGDTVAGPELLAQLNELRQRNEQLQTELVEARSSTGGVDSGSLASLDEATDVSGTFMLSHETQNRRWEHNMTWNQILGVIGPRLLNPTPEPSVNRI